MIARNTLADINVIALIGERGREVKEFIDNDLEEEMQRRFQNTILKQKSIMDRLQLTRQI